MHHFVQRWCDQSGESDDIGAEFCSLVQNGFSGDHDAEIFNVVAVACEYDADDVLADIVYVALDGCEQDLALAGRLAAIFFGIHEGFEVGNRTLHDAGAFHHLRQEHLSGPEEVADNLHSVHQRPFDHQKGAAQFLASLLGVFLDEVDEALDQCVREAFFDRPLAPGQILDTLGTLAADRLGQFDQSLGGIRATIENRVLDML